MNATWFNECRYGMFIHWGPYSVAARGEWVMNRERIPKEEYTSRFVNRWHAEHYNPESWVELAQASAMGYMVLTTRHHDGFALWDSKINPWNAARLGPRRDLVAEYVEACRKAGMKIGFYYSPASWTHPDYPGPFFRDWPGPQDWPGEEARQRFIAYYREELQELLTRYGKIDYLWFDGCIPANIDGEETLKMVKALQPHILVNNRLGEPFDIQCCEQAIKPAAPGQDWEACMTLNGNWGYHAGDCHWKTPRSVIHMLLTCAAKAGNLLLNVGPRPDGTIPEASARILKEAGAWIARNRESITHSQRHPFSWNCTAGAITMRGNRIYLHFTNQPGGEFCWAELRNRVIRARFLCTGESIRFDQRGERLFLLDLPNPLPDSPVTTVVLEVEGQPEAITSQTTFWIPG